MRRALAMFRARLGQRSTLHFLYLPVVDVYHWFQSVSVVLHPGLNAFVCFAYMINLLCIILPSILVQDG
jgi:hypothetical protein